jgi:DNA polymerase III delta subunit
MTKQAYFISSDDLFLVDEAKNKLVSALKIKKQAEIVRLSCYGNENLQDDIAELKIPDLFAAHKVLVLTAAEGKWHQSTVKAITTLLENIEKTPTITVVIALCQFKSQQLKTKALQAIQKCCQVKLIPVPKDLKLNQWIQKQSSSYQLSLNPEAITYLKEHSHGHLYACDQLLQKCALMGLKNISDNDLIQIMSDFSKYTIYDLVAAIAKGDKQSEAIFDYLVSQKAALTLILWNIINLLKLSYTASFEMKYLGIPLSQVLSKLWYQQKTDTENLIKRLSITQINLCLQQAYAIDKQVKSKGAEESAMAIHHIILSMLNGAAICVD